MPDSLSISDNHIPRPATETPAADTSHVAATHHAHALTDSATHAPTDSAAHAFRIQRSATRDTTPVTIPRYGRDTVINTDLHAALSATYSTTGIDTAALKIAVPLKKSTWEDGLEGTPRPINAGDNSGVLTIITGMFVVMMFGFRQSKRLFKVLLKDLLGMRSPNVFDEHTSNETGVLTLMAMQWSVYTGLLLYILLSYLYNLPPAYAFTDIGRLILLTAGYYIFQLTAYNLVGYTFTSAEGRTYYVKGFTASQSLLSFLLIIPALVALFYRDASEAMLIASGALYLCFRVIFIIKGFRIFYQKIQSLLYFILYLCTLEIVPLIVLYNIALSLVNSD